MLSFRIPKPCLMWYRTFFKMAGRPVSPIAILATNCSVTKNTKRKVTTEIERPLKKQRCGNGTDAKTNSGQTTLESVIAVKSFSDKRKVMSGHTSRGELLFKKMWSYLMVSLHWAISTTSEKTPYVEMFKALEIWKSGWWVNISKCHSWKRYAEY